VKDMLLNVFGTVTLIGLLFGGASLVGMFTTYFAGLFIPPALVGNTIQGIALCVVGTIGAVLVSLRKLDEYELLY
jgi:hypothetical protein